MSSEVFNERDEIAVTGKENDRIEFRCHGDGVDRHADVPVGLLRTAKEDLQVFGARLDSYFAQGLKKALFFATFRRDHVRASSDQSATGN